MLVREQQDRSKNVLEENEILLRRKQELEGRLTTLELEYEELLGKYSIVRRAVGTDGRGVADKTIQEDEQADSNLSANLQDIKVRHLLPLHDH